MEVAVYAEIFFFLQHVVKSVLLDFTTRPNGYKLQLATVATDSQQPQQQHMHLGVMQLFGAAAVSQLTFSSVSSKLLILFFSNRSFTVRRCISTALNSKVYRPIW